MTDTPRTDAAFSTGMNNASHWAEDRDACQETCHQLERELAEALMSIDATNGDYIAMRQRALKAERELAEARNKALEEVRIAAQDEFGSDVGEFIRALKEKP